jgi:hypothetical protein
VYKFRTSNDGISTYQKWGISPIRISLGSSAERNRGELCRQCNLKIFFDLTLVHFTGDFHTSFINPLFPVFVDKFGLTLTQIGIIAGVVDLLAFVIQGSVRWCFVAAGSEQSKS